jgi:hypothetical protein
MVKSYRQLGKMRSVTMEDGLWHVTMSRCELRLDRLHLGALLSEWDDWLRFYLPPFPFGGKIVLDVGAGCGETAAFFFNQGAKRVIAVEKDELCATLLRANVKRNSWNAEVYAQPFEISMLDELKFDYMKMDIEGGESVLLERDFLPPCSIEVHGRKLLDALSSKFRLECQPSGPGMWMLKHG